MDPDFDYNYTMYCGGGGDGGSGGNGSDATSPGDTGGAGGADGAGGSDASSGSGGGSGDTGDMGSEAANVASTESGAASVGAGSPSDTGDLGSVTANEQATAQGAESVGVETDGITNYSYSKADALASALTATKLESQLNIGLTGKTGTVIGLLTGLPISTLAKTASVLSNYNAFRSVSDPMSAVTPDETTSSGTTATQADSGGNDNENINTYIQTSQPLQNIRDSAAIKFLTNVKAMDISDKYDLAKARVSNTINSQINGSNTPLSPFGLVALQGTPFYNFFKEQNIGNQSQVQNNIFEPYLKSKGLL